MMIDDDDDSYNTRLPIQGDYSFRRSEFDFAVHTYFRSPPLELIMKTILQSPPLELLDDPMKSSNILMKEERSMDWCVKCDANYDFMRWNHI